MGKALMTRFGPHSAAIWETMELWNERNQLEAESVDEYFISLTKLGKELGINKHMLKNRLVMGLLPHISQFVKERNPSDLNTALEYAKIGSALRKHKHSDSINRAAKSAQLASLQSVHGPEMPKVKFDKQLWPVSTKADTLKNKPQCKIRT